MDAVQGRAALITGGASGIGNAIAEALARRGVCVTIGDINPDVERIAEETAQRSGGTVVGMRLDVTSLESVQQVVDGTVARFGRLDILGNIAGIYQKLSVVDMTPEQWDRTLDINLKGVYLCTHVALPHMIRQRYGRIVGITSGLGVVGAPASSAYAASKAGVVAFTKAVAAEVFSHGITVNCIAPGITDTPLMRGANTDAEVEMFVARMQRPLGKPRDVVAPFLFLVGEDTANVSGVTLWLRNP